MGEFVLQTSPSSPQGTHHERRLTWLAECLSPHNHHTPLRDLQGTLSVRNPQNRQRQFQMLNRRITLSTVKTERSQPFLVRLFLAIIAFKRMIAMRRKWEITKKQKLATTKSTLILEIHKSQRAVKYASFGRSVIGLDEDRIRIYRQEEYERKEKEKEKRHELQQLRTRRRFGMRTYGDMKQLESGPSSPLLDPYSLTVADRIRALRSKYSAADFYRDESASKKLIPSRQTLINKEGTISSNKEFANILQKNLHISRPQDAGTQSSESRNSPHITHFTSLPASKIKSNLRNMKKLDLQEVLNYAPGTAVYFGATVAVQSRHGGFLSFNNASDIRASAHKILPSARFTIWNCDELQDHGVVRYGDAVWLQVRSSCHRALIRFSRPGCMKSSVRSMAAKSLHLIAEGCERSTPP
jgi:hypothetical protein